MLKPFLVARVRGSPPYWTCWPSSRIVKAAAKAAVHPQAATCFRNTILVFTPPHCAHSNLCIERSWRVGCRSMRASFIGLRHLGQVSFINRSKDMARPFVGSVADVLARSHRTICKNPRNAARVASLSTAVSVRQALYMGTAISNYDDKHAIPTIGRRQEACLIRSGLCGPTLFQVSERYPLLAPQLIAI